MQLDTYQVPEWAQQRIRLEGGVNEIGKPNFRIVWGGSRLITIGGKWFNYDRHGNKLSEQVEYRQVPKYMDAVNRFVVEQWCFPELTREAWAANFTKSFDGKFMETMGPYEEQGDYELLKVLETPCTCSGNCENRKHGQFVTLTATILEAIINVARVNKHIPVKDRMEFSRKRRERAEESKLSRMEAIISNAARPSWAINPHVVLSHMKEGV